MANTENFTYFVEETIILLPTIFGVLENFFQHGLPYKNGNKWVGSIKICKSCGKMTSIFLPVHPGIFV